MVNQPAPDGSTRTRAFLAEFLQVFARTGDLGETFDWAMEPDCTIYFGNGDIGGRAASQHHAETNRVALSDMAVEFEEASFFGDQVVVQYWMSGTVEEGVRWMPAGQRYRFRGASVGRVSERSRLSETWSYSNASFGFAFPPTGVNLAPPPVDTAANEGHVRAVYDAWLRAASAGADFMDAVASTIAPDGVVHFGNGDSGDAEYLRSFFREVAEALPDLSLAIEQVLVNDTRLVVQFQMTGTHLGVLSGKPPTGRPLPSRGMLVARPDHNARVAELWVYVAPGYSLVHPPGTGLNEGAGNEGTGPKDG